MPYRSVQLSTNIVDQVNLSADKEPDSLYIPDNDDDLLSELAIKRYFAEKKSAIKVELD